MKVPLCWGKRPSVMGVINLTPDSFSDGGLHNSPEKAVQQASKQLSSGADLLDLGAQSTRPGAEEVGTAEEIDRLIPALRAIRDKHADAIISIDTYQSEVAKEALNNGADWINDVSGGKHDPEMLHVIADAGCPYVLMHSRGNSQTMDGLVHYSEDVVEDIYRELEAAQEQALKAGVREEQIIWDPGLGFAKTTDQNLKLLKGLETLSRSKKPILLGPSRKRFIGDVLNEPRSRARLWGTAAVCCRAVEAEVAVLRVHDVRPIAEIVRMSTSLWPIR